MTKRKNRYLIGKPRESTNITSALNFSAFPSVSSNRLNQTIKDGELDIQALHGLLNEMSDFTVLDSVVSEGQEEILVVEVSSEGVEALQSVYGAGIIVEPDESLDLLASSSTPSMDTFSTSAVPLDESTLEVTVMVKGGTPPSPVEKAEVYLGGSVWSARGFTDANGKVRLTLFGETEDSLRVLFVKPRDTFWNVWIDNPTLDDLDVELTSLRDFLQQSPNEAFDWGHKAMGLDKISGQWRGQGVRVGVIDSGLENQHEDITGFDGRDFTQGATQPEHSWQQDAIGHGSHVTGTIAALHNQRGIKAFAPESEVHALKVFPGGRISDLIRSLSYCITKNIDIVNMSLGINSHSLLLEQKINEATEAGVACFAAAGNSAGEILYPAAFQNVMAVAAIGKFGTFPENSYHQKQVGEHKQGDYFTARFTCFEGERARIDVCAPGVAITSSVPSGTASYAAWDGTSMACPHVAGLAALVLEAKPEIRNLPRNRQRVEALFQAIKDSCRDLGLPEAFQGAGLPDAINALDGVSNADDSLARLEQLLVEAIDIIRQQGLSA